jgi:protein-L-isoaspartate(D-aspartate) O-methyltransferase
VEVIEGDGSKGYPEEAPYDGIIVTAGAPEIPRPLTEQLADSGRLIIPVGGSGSQVLILAKRQGDKVVTRELGSCAFVPLVGRYGWAGRGDGQSRRNRR